MTQLTTTGETYFFRDKGQFALLKNWILPELIRKNEKDHVLRIWSAGCSSGEEPYSLAILVDELFQGRNDWDVFIIGTDVNEDFIGKARRGSYGEWSFRQVGDEIRERYFQKKRNEWQINERIRKKVRFEVMDLITDIYPDYGRNLYDMDLILCRNVFIYFNPEVVSKTVEKMATTLRDGGCLMTGHAEIRARELPSLKAKVFPESLVYQKTAVSGQSSAVSERYLPEVRIQKPEISKKIESRIQESEVGMEKSETEILDSEFCILESKKDLVPPTPDSKLKEARSLADRGRYDDAARYCNDAIKIDPFGPEPYYILAQIAREKGEVEREKEMLKRVIYLNPSHLAAYLELGIIYEDEGDEARALKMRATALGLLNATSKDARIEPYTDFTAGELKEHLEKIVK